MTERQRLQRVYQGYTAEKWNPENPGNAAILLERERMIRILLTQSGYLPLQTRRVLDVGCGSGNALARFLALGARPDRLVGVDLLEDRVAAARRQYPELTFSCQSAEALDFPAGTFDLTLVMTLFSSILDDGVARNVAREVTRVLKPGGAILWYDIRYSNPVNKNVRRFGRREIHALFPDFQGRLYSLTVLPPLVRRLGRWTASMYRELAKVPFLRTHYLGLLQRKEFN
jgi:SAM-dependent methyltransferase